MYYPLLKVTFSDLMLVRVYMLYIMKSIQIIDRWANFACVQRIYCEIIIGNCRAKCRWNWVLKKICSISSYLLNWAEFLKAALSDRRIYAFWSSSPAAANVKEVFAWKVMRNFRSYSCLERRIYLTFDNAKFATESSWWQQQFLQECGPRKFDTFRSRTPHRSPHTTSHIVSQNVMVQVPTVSVTTGFSVWLSTFSIKFQVITLVWGNYARP